jgi:hypothetical protein
VVKIKKIIGWSLVTLVVSAFILAMVLVYGFNDTLIALGITITISGVALLAVYLITNDY